MTCEYLTVGALAKRSGLSISAIHFYETKGLIISQRNLSNHRIFKRDTLRRLAIIKAAKNLGMPLVSIQQAFKTLPQNRTPKKADWAKLSARWHDELSLRITQLTRLRDQLTSCIGCGCLSVEKCQLINADDHLAIKASGGVLLEK
ncbi:redox-sensitive transcriptional activator SoxR [Thiotrichales bacterium 19X7-9]|nr:redox-sensitive transcriptional activator SoxR [Thiotrichales bacterium 19X7-9]